MQSRPPCTRGHVDLEEGQPERRHLIVDPRNGARAVIRDTGADAGRFLWSVLAAGEMDPLSDGRTDDLARAHFLAEAALRAYAR